MAANTSLSARLSTAETSHLGAGAAALAIAGLITASPKVRKALFTREDVFNLYTFSACFEGEKLAVTKAVETCGAAEADHFLINLGLLTCSAFFAWRAARLLLVA